ncbi:hypothetical protein E5288_WYG006958 [Bos mutus]|uniref:Uncharacterized protein n=1 Tax=Bos mutus TaxID=72004 RepID=A0A6B0QRZ5_9CETA|nr:hypothetical protein [Bos mutus]
MTGLLSLAFDREPADETPSPEPPDMGGPGKANSPVQSPPEADWTFHKWTHELYYDNGKQNPKHKKCRAEGFQTVHGSSKLLISPTRQRYWERSSQSPERSRRATVEGEGFSVSPLTALS